MTALECSQALWCPALLYLTWSLGNVQLNACACNSTCSMDTVQLQQLLVCAVLHTSMVHCVSNKLLTYLSGTVQQGMQCVQLHMCSARDAGGSGLEVRQVIHCRLTYQC